jgi:hypothetical protein
MLRRRENKEGMQVRNKARKKRVPRDCRRNAVGGLGLGL